MKLSYFVLLFLNFLFLSNQIVFSQTKSPNLEGKWIKYKMEMKDGSKVFNRNISESKNLYFLFKNDSIYVSNDNIGMEYKQADDYITIKNKINYRIDYFKNDTLILHEEIKGLDDDKAFRYYLISNSVAQEYYRKKFISKNDIVASIQYTPTITASFINKLSNGFKDIQTQFTVSGYLIIFPKEKRIETFLIDSNAKITKECKTLKKVINNSIESWDISDFLQYNSVQIPFFFKRVYIKYKQTPFTAEIFSPFHNNNNDSYKDIKQQEQQIEKANQFFKKGLDSYQNKNFIKALEYFSKAHELDPYNIDALYNRALIYYETHELDKACEDWKTLSDLGQVKAKEFYESKCLQKAN